VREEVDDPVLEVVLVEVEEELLAGLLVELLLSKDLSSSGHSRALPFLGMQPMPVVEQLDVALQASISC
jgi:hypothetical protein